MRNILAPSNSAVLGQLARSRVLLGFDFDGTLAPIVRDPSAARMRQRTRRLLAELAQHYPCVVISGRARSDVLERLRGVRLLAVVGNHGMETGRVTCRHRARIATWVAVISDRVATFPGVVVEDKGLSLAVHYRHSGQKREAVEAILDVVRKLRGAEMVPGKQVVNIVPEDAPNKGQALAMLRRRARCDGALFLGDDDTDETAFALARKSDLLAIRVGHRPGSSAPFYIESQARVDDLLERLILVAGERRATRNAR